MPILANEIGIDVAKDWLDISLGGVFSALAVGTDSATGLDHVGRP